MKTSPKGVALIKEFEGFVGRAYRDPVGIWTIGYGFIRGVKPGDTMTPAQGEARLRHELGEYEAAVWAATRGQVNQHEFDALVCFAFNIGTAGMAGSSVIKAHRRGDKQAAARAFGLWNKAGGRVFAGLTRRRAAEAALYLEPVPDDVSDPLDGPRDPMPQRVDAERPMSASTINRAAGLAGGASALAAVSEIASVATQASDAAQQAKSAASGIAPALGGQLSGYLVPALLIAVVCLCGYIAWERIKQRREGWA
jgi:lysozyme